MKQLARYSMKRLAMILLILSFLISNGISYKTREKAQSNFAKNALSFLLMEENNADFYKTLEKFNNSHRDLSVVYIGKDSQTLFNPDRIEIKNYSKFNFANEKYNSHTSLYESLTNQTVYGQKGENILLISYIHNIGFYINVYLLLLYILLAILIKYFIDKYVSNKLDDYIKDMSYNNYDMILKDSRYEDIKWPLKTYVDQINTLSLESEDLKSRLSEFTNITSNMKEGFILFDGDGNVELINNSAKKYLAADEKSHITNLIDDREYNLALREASILKRSKILDIKLNGYYLRIFIDPLSTSTQKAYAMIIIDNSEEMKSEKMRREFSANVTHELKSPLTSINGYAELIATGIAKEDDVNKFAEIIYKEGNRLLDIIDDILKISRLDENNFDKDFIEVDIAEVVNATIEKYLRLTDNKNIKVINNIKPYKIKTSKSLFYDLVSNIYENAIKYNKVGGDITVSYELGQNSYFLSISDSGIGIAPADTKRIFERFYVVDKSRKRNQKSTGLGLSIVKHIISYLGYDIKVESKLNEGTTFIIEIPLGLDRKDSL
ncbi:cell wall metabolism sensor histidine kinase WalK [uncultured Anaerococcus sp.]|uniref:sensor histidine kinase n=1 Tax=uncultured Anaerococcus sp. TaxID=293428 RepID=UPI0025D16BE1|nr:ATP-binding protein [uncultured Anaerococcus sp.]